MPAKPHLLAAATAIALFTGTPSLAQIQPNTLNGRLDSNSFVVPEQNKYFNLHTFEGHAGEQITIELTSSEFDPALGLSDSENNLIARDYDSGEGNNARIIVTLSTTGTYTVVAMSEEVGETGNYTLSWQQSTAEELELAAAEELNQQVLELYQQGQYATAIPLAEGSLVIREKVLGDEHPDVATSLNNLALLYHAMGNYSEAEPLYQRSLTIWEKVLGDEHPDVATSLNNLAGLYRAMGNYSEAEPLYQRSLAILEQALGAEHPDVALSLNNLANLYSDMGNYSEAEPLYQLSLSIREKILGTEHPNVAETLNSLALLYHAMGNYSEAEPLYQRSINTYEKALGDEHPDIAKSLGNLAGLYQAMGNYSEAEPLYQRSLAILEKVLGDEHPHVATTLNNLAELYRAMGNYSEAEPLYQRSLAIREKVLGDEHPHVATTLNNLAELYRAMGNYSEAEPLYQRSLAILEKVLGDEHPHVATTLNNLAELYRAMGNYSEAEPLYQRSLAIYEKALGDEHPHVATTLNNLALLYHAMGNYSEAEPLYQRSLVIREKVLGDKHPDVAKSLGNLAGLYLTQGDIPRATEFLTRGTNIEEANLTHLFTTGSEKQKQAYAKTFRNTTYRTISLHLQDAPNNPQAARLALTTLLRRKGRILDALSENLQLLRQNLTLANQTLLDDLLETRSHLATLVYRRPEDIRDPATHRQQLDNLTAEAEDLEAELSRRSAEFRTATEPVTIEAIQQLIPADAALVELVQYRPFNPKASRSERWGSPRYAAYILHATGEPQWADLGEAATIDAAVTEFREALQSVPGFGIDNFDTTANRHLYSRLIEPLQQKLGNARHLILSPDGQLNLIPFAALMDENGEYLLETHALTYLTTGRDLLAQQQTIPSQQPPVIFANPDYTNPGNPNSVELVANLGNLASATDISTDNPSDSNLVANTTRSAGFALTFGGLPNTADEAEAIVPLFPNSTVLSQSNATENVLKRLNSPNILHLATHGFFLEIETPEPTADSPFGSFSDTFRPQPANQENPLLRSGLALAGANPRQSGLDDGILTALEVAGLRLRGTQLVVLSACETGVGDTATGEGVYGLRRALTISGTQTQILSLWNVDTYATERLMVDYYGRLANGEERGEALRQVQLQMLRGETYQHPGYWSGFLPSGAWGAME
ncbi:MAG: tetratricopeptide repeat protein [Cyanobacteriota bacterium]|nr:tetratricopeptide repeat protein [Cyanobacteriota bacterium]